MPNIGIVYWNNEENVPIVNEESEPLYNWNVPDRNLNGTFKKKSTPKANISAKECDQVGNQDVLEKSTPEANISDTECDKNRCTDGKYRRIGTPLDSNEVITSSAQSQSLDDITSTPGVDPEGRFGGSSSDNMPAPHECRKSTRNPNTKQDNITILQSKILNNEREGLEIIDCGSIIGRGIQTTKPFSKSEYVCTYQGDLIDRFEAEHREIEYAKEAEAKGEKGDDKCFTHYFRWNEAVWCYDGTEDKGTYGRLINHSRLHPNIIPKVEVIDDIPYIWFKSINGINAGVELRYDYGDRKSQLEWLKY